MVRRIAVPHLFLISVNELGDKKARGSSLGRPKVDCATGNDVKTPTHGLKKPVLASGIYESVAFVVHGDGPFGLVSRSISMMGVYTVSHTWSNVVGGYKCHHVLALPG